MIRIIKRFLAKVLLKLLGWKIVVNVNEIPAKCVVIGAPHSSWIDVVIGLSAASVLNLSLHFLAKKELFDFPWSLLFKRLKGGIAVDRYSEEGANSRKDVIQQVVDMFNSKEEMRLIISPEGTRKKVNRWKTGFYRIAQRANVPIVLCYIDHKQKIGCIDKLFFPTGQLKEDMKGIMQYFSKIPVKNMHKFALDERYSFKKSKKPIK